NLMKGGHQLVVNDVRREAAAPHLQAGATWADTPRAVAEATDVVFTSLPGPVEVEAVALGEQGLGAGLAAGKVYFDLSTNSPALVRRIHEEFKKKGIHMLDAPVSGGPRGAESGRLALWVGGEEDVFKRHKPVLDAIGDQAYYVGPIGAGSVAKLVHNCAGYIVQTALAEVFTMGVKAGVEPIAALARERQIVAVHYHALGTPGPLHNGARLVHGSVTMAAPTGWIKDRFVQSLEARLGLQQIRNVPEPRFAYLERERAAPDARALKRTFERGLVFDFYSPWQYLPAAGGRLYRASEIQVRLLRLDDLSLLWADSFR